MLGKHTNEILYQLDPRVKLVRLVVLELIKNRLLPAVTVLRMRGLAAPPRTKFICCPTKYELGSGNDKVGVLVTKVVFNI